MTDSIGVIPAAGLGSRWGGYPKFLLPCGNGQWLLDRTLKMFPVHQSVVVYGDVTLNYIVDHLDRCGKMDDVILCRNTRMDLDFWGSILAALEIEADYYYFAMPDTYPDPGPFYEMIGTKGISLGTHWTLMPERFGVIRNGRAVNKSAGEPGWAWGTLGWTKEVRDLWLYSALENYTQAINLAIQEYGLNCFPMAYYYDMATWEDYARFVKVMF